jgi:hypothetical protein
VHWHFVATGENHEGLDRGLAQFRRPPHRDLILAVEFKCEEQGSLPGRVGGIDAGGLQQVSR